MTNHLEKGDAVTLSQNLAVEEKTDAYGKKYLYANISWSDDKKKPPFTIYDSIVGIYTGVSYIPIQQGRRGINQIPHHRFYFAEHEIFIDPSNVKVVAKFNESLPEGSEGEE